jgi:pantetheine-phosphate adenylyltransferase
VRCAVYAGTFDPITWGHVSVIERSAALFDELCVVIAVNPRKEPLFSAEERLALITAVTEHVPNVHCAITSGYVVEHARSLGARYLVRGVRGVTDMEAELTLSRLNHQLAPEIETVFVPARMDLAEVSSSRLKEMVRRGQDVSLYCLPLVAARLREVLGV